MLSLASALIAALPMQQDPPADLAAVLAAERRRIEVMDRVTPAVCAVMPVDELCPC